MCKSELVCKRFIHSFHMTLSNPLCRKQNWHKTISTRVSLYSPQKQQVRESHSVKTKAVEQNHADHLPRRLIKASFWTQTSFTLKQTPGFSNQSTLSLSALPHFQDPRQRWMLFAAWHKLSEQQGRREPTALSGKSPKYILSALSLSASLSQHSLWSQCC